MFISGLDSGHYQQFTDSENDLDVTLSRNLKFSAHIRLHANKASAILGRLRPTFRFWAVYMVSLLFCAFVRIHRKHAAIFWCSHTAKHIYVLILFSSSRIKKDTQSEFSEFSYKWFSKNFDG
ncbi:hypothetical protein BpHYR1_010712 [Brachionus plicatilis]|uniref:Uncharacterized protein n=1 Tax=Brachionus plicatilis TaxID=10195 RepID=A0A3M7SKC3_BRAPC|nr:hypothetical protein BpHYR1_010712 [Brachionus plicatilis]